MINCSRRFTMLYFLVSLDRSLTVLIKYIYIYTGEGQFFLTVYMNAFSTYIGFLNGFSTCSLVI